MKEGFFAVILLICLKSWSSAFTFTKGEHAPIVPHDWHGWHNNSFSSHFLLQAASHSLFIEIAKGTLDMTNFLGFMQQDDVYVTSLFDSIQIIHDRVPESDDYTRRELAGILESREYYRNFFDAIYQNSSFDITIPKEMNPATVDYMAFQRYAAQYEHIGVALTTLFPCYTVWHEMGIIIEPIANLEINRDHPYYYFIRANTAYIDDNTGLKEFENLVTHHYNNPSASNELEAIAVRKRMFETYLLGIDQERNFAESGLTMEAEIRNSEVLTFTDLVESKVAVNLQKQMINHDLWQQLAEGTLQFINFKKLIQQDVNYLIGFYEAFEIMANTETDPELRQLLIKNGTAKVESFKELLSVYGIKLNAPVEPYTQNYIDFIISSASSSVHEGLAALYPCYYLWYEVANQPFMIEADKNPNHPFKYFITAALISDGSSLARMKKLVDRYYELQGDDWVRKERMFRAAESGTHFEFLFADGAMNSPSHIN